MGRGARWPESGEEKNYSFYECQSVVLGEGDIWQGLEAFLIAMTGEEGGEVPLGIY